MTEHEPTYEELATRVAALEQEQAAVAAVLRIISGAPADLQPVLDALAESAARLCDAADAGIYRVAGDAVVVAATYGPMFTTLRGQTWPLDRGSLTGRAILERRTITVDDLAAESDVEYPTGKALQARFGYHSALAVPLLREGNAIGTISLSRPEVQPFTDKEIALVQTFADQAVIAIENARLLEEVQTRNRELGEALERQTAMAEILSVINSSATDIEPVLLAVIERAVRLCNVDAASIWRRHGDELHRVDGDFPSRSQEAFREAYASHLVPTVEPVGGPGPVGTAAATGRSHRYTLKPDDPRITDPIAVQRMAITGGTSGIAVPLLSGDSVIGVLEVFVRGERRFTDRETQLLQTFADQVVIAIENARLFDEVQARTRELEDRNRELTEALEQQTATAEILSIISRSPTDVRPVLDAIVQRAAALCEASDAVIRLVESSGARLVAYTGRRPGERLGGLRPITRGWPAGRAILDGTPIHIHDIDAVPEEEYPDTQVRGQGVGTMLSIPLMREGTAIGVFIAIRWAVQPFTGQQIALLQTFADQAVIAIENARLFKELEQRNGELAQALERADAMAETLSIISRSPTDIEPVMEAIARTAARLCHADASNIRQVEDGFLMRLVTGPGAVQTPPALSPEPLTRDSMGGAAILDRRVYQVEDILALPPGQYPRAREIAEALGLRTLLAVPLLRGEEAVGGISLARRAVKAFTEDEIALTQTFADQAVIALENARLFNELEQRSRELAESVERLQALGEVTRTVSSTLDLNEVLRTIIRHAQQLCTTDDVAIFAFDAATQEFHLHVQAGVEEDISRELAERPLRLGEGTVGRAGQVRRPVQVADILTDEAYTSRLRPALLQAGNRAILAVPLLREDDLLGAIAVTRRQPGEFPPEVVELLKTFADQSALAIHNADLFHELEVKTRQLEVAGRHKSEFLANMSHELRTPLNAINGFSEVLLEQMFGGLNEKQTEYLQDILSSGQHLLALINDILDLSKVEAGHMELEPAEFSLVEALEHSLAMVRERAARHGLALTLDVAPDVDVIEADERKVKQVLFNLLSNAVKFTPDGGAIDLTARRAGEMVEVAVRDTGIGIAPEDLERIFEEFQQADHPLTKRHEGTGLGLALARRFVELHDGRLWVASEPGQGSTFTFTLPLARDGAAATVDHDTNRV